VCIIKWLSNGQAATAGASDTTNNTTSSENGAQTTHNSNSEQLVDEEQTTGSVPHPNFSQINTNANSTEEQLEESENWDSFGATAEQTNSNCSELSKLAVKSSRKDLSSPNSFVDSETDSSVIMADDQHQHEGEVKGDGDRVNFVLGDEGDSAAEDNGDIVMVGGERERRESSTSQSSDTLQDFISPVNGRTMDGHMALMERRRRLRPSMSYGTMLRDGRFVDSRELIFATTEELVKKLGGTKNINKVLIANNGIAAVKCMRSIRRWAYEVFRNERAIRFVVMVTPEDLKANAEYIKMADHYVPVPGGANNNNYANVELILDIAKRMQVQAVWAGWGHASENPKLPELLHKANIAFIGPPEKAMWALGDKIASSIVAQTAGVPTLPWSGTGLTATSGKDKKIKISSDLYKQGCVETAEEGLVAAQKNWFPRHDQSQ